MPVADLSLQRRMMVDGQIRTYGVTDGALIECFLRVPREVFVAAKSAELAYSDAVLPLEAGKGRSLLTPMVLARMIEGARPLPGERALDIGGAGYGAAVLAGLVAHVVAVDCDAVVIEAMMAAARALGIANLQGVTASLASGCARLGPYDVILVNGAVEREPEELLAQLADGGRLMAIVNQPGQNQGQVVRFEKSGRTIGQRVLLDASAPVLEGFAAPALFAF